MEQQNEACLQLESIIKLKSETEYFENSLLAMFGIKRKRDLGADLHNTITKYSINNVDFKDFQSKINKNRSSLQKLSKGLKLLRRQLAYLSILWTK